MVGNSYEVRELPGRRIAAARSHKWNVAARLGPQARGDATEYLRQVEETPPAPRRSSLRGASHFLHAPWLIGAPASINTDASLGFSRIGYQFATEGKISFSVQKRHCRGARTHLGALLRGDGKSDFAFVVRDSRELPYRFSVRRVVAICLRARVYNFGDTWARRLRATRQHASTKTEAARFFQIGIGQR